MIVDLVKYDPFREMRNLQDEVNRLFSSSFSRSNKSDPVRGSWNPNVDIYENNEQIVLEAELPGMKPDAVDVSIENNILTIHGNVNSRKKPKEIISIALSDATAYLHVHLRFRRRFRVNTPGPNLKTARCA